MYQIRSLSPPGSRPWFLLPKYSFVGGFVGTSNVQALHVIPTAGTHTHTFVQTQASLDEIEDSRGIQLDSGTLVYLSLEVAKYSSGMQEERPFFGGLDIVASNNINKEELISLRRQGHAIILFGIS